jgi:uncharacterized iron-regulated membrane protein
VFYFTFTDSFVESGQPGTVLGIVLFVCGIILIIASGILLYRARKNNKTEDEEPGVYTRT